MAPNKTEVHELIKNILERPGNHIQDRGWDRLRTHLWIYYNSKEYQNALIVQPLQSMAHTIQTLRKWGLQLKEPIFYEIQDLAKRQLTGLDKKKIVQFESAKQYGNFRIESSITNQTITFEGKRPMKADVLFKKIDKYLNAVQKAIKKNRKLYSIYLEKEIERFNEIKSNYEKELAEKKEQYRSINQKPILTESELIKPYIDAFNKKWQRRYRKHLGFFKKRESEELQNLQEQIRNWNEKIHAFTLLRNKILTIQTLR